MYPPDARWKWNFPSHCQAQRGEGPLCAADNPPCAWWALPAVRSTTPGVAGGLGRDEEAEKWVTAVGTKPDGPLLVWAF